MPDLYSIAYVSRNAIKGNPQEMDTEIRSILETARSNNRLIHVTGALLFSHGFFAQILEGPQQAVESMFESIQGDPRHTDVTILHLHPITERSFPGWSMAYAGTDHQHRERALADEVLPSPAAIPTEAQGQSFLNVLSDYISRQEA